MPARVPAPAPGRPQQLGQCDEIRLIDDNPHLRALALSLLASSATPALRNATYDQGDLGDAAARAARRPIS